MQLLAKILAASLRYLCIIISTQNSTYHGNTSTNNDPNHGAS